jgi:hypothetical protein
MPRIAPDDAMKIKVMRVGGATTTIIAASVRDPVALAPVKFAWPGIG